MDAEVADKCTAKYPLGDLIAEGKTKKVYGVRNNPQLAILSSKDDITAGDGKKHDVIPNKANLANRTTCNVFRLLKAAGVPTAFVEQDSLTSFVAKHCKMLPWEVVVRREAHGSYLERNPGVLKGHLFPKLLTELFLKTNGKQWKGKPLVCDDPYAHFVPGKILLYNAHAPLEAQQPFLSLPESEVLSNEDEKKLLGVMRRIAREAFLVLERAWQLQGGRLVDLKVEFGIDAKGNLLLADVVDNDSWRIVKDGGYIDKQVYRDGGQLSEVAEKFLQVAGLTDRFGLPQQRIILWTGSKTDDLQPFYTELDDILGLSGVNRTGSTMVLPVVCSIHKKPVEAIRTLHHLTQEVPDSVIIAYVGMSNGAGPTLSAHTTVPVISVPASFRDFPEDLWSSLRLPSQVPALTVLKPATAVHAALNILSARNPHLYAVLRTAIEERLENVTPLE